jgi:hypothetical protein
MKARILAAALGLAAATTPALSATYNLGLLDMTKPLYHAFTNFTGSFTDIYTFTLPGATQGVMGDTTTINFGDLWNVQLSGATLTGTGIGSLTDSNPNDGFSFGGLTGGGSYSLAISGKVNGSGLAGVTGIYAGYVSPVPEPEAIALTLVGLLATGAALRRRS